MPDRGMLSAGKMEDDRGIWSFAEKWEKKEIASIRQSKVSIKPSNVPDRRAIRTESLSFWKQPEMLRVAEERVLWVVG